MAAATISAGGKLDPSDVRPASTIALLAPLIVVLAVVFIPVLDFLLAVIRRTKEGRHPFSADKQHLHHRMLNIGHTHRQAVLIFYLWALVLAAARCRWSSSLAGGDPAVLIGWWRSAWCSPCGRGCGPGGSAGAVEDDVEARGPMSSPAAGKPVDLSKETDGPPRSIADRSRSAVLVAGPPETLLDRVARGRTRAGRRRRVDQRSWCASWGSCSAR